jgi:hypothetical protein
MRSACLQRSLQEARNIDIGLAVCLVRRTKRASLLSNLESMLTAYNRLKHQDNGLLRSHGTKLCSWHKGSNLTAISERQQWTCIISTS